MRRNRVLMMMFVAITGLNLVACDDENTQNDKNSLDGQACDPTWGVQRPSRNQCWTKPSASIDSYWEDAVQYCNSLKLGGNTDWFLPSKSDYELILRNCVEENDDFGFLDSIQCDGCADSAECSSMFGNDEWWYWTATNYAGSDDYWDVDLSDGALEITATGNMRGVLCVRNLK
jgi:hypothetical protein